MKKTLIVILCAISLGGGIAYYLFNKIVVKASPSDTTIVSAFQIGAFTNYDNALKVADRNNGIVIKDEDIFRVYIAIIHNQEVISKLKKHYSEIGLNYYLKQIPAKKEFIEQTSSIEELLNKSSSNTYVVLNSEILEKYKELH